MEAPATALLLASWPIPAEMRPVKCLPNANSSVAASISQGITCKKVCAGVLISSTAPAMPPTTLVTINGTITRREMRSRLRYAPPLAVTPIHKASVLVALAATGATPVNSSAGNAMKLPPPATAFSPPPTAAEKNKKMACPTVKPDKFVKPEEEAMPDKLVKPPKLVKLDKMPKLDLYHGWRALLQLAPQASPRSTLPRSSVGLSQPAEARHPRTPLVRVATHSLDNAHRCIYERTVSKPLFSCGWQSASRTPGTGNAAEGVFLTNEGLPSAFVSVAAHGPRGTAQAQAIARPQIYRRKHGQQNQRDGGGNLGRVQHPQGNLRLLRRHHDRVVRLLHFWQPSRSSLLEILSARKRYLRIYRLPGDLCGGISCAPVRSAVLRADWRPYRPQVRFSRHPDDHGRRHGPHRIAAHL